MLQFIKAVLSDHVLWLGSRLQAAIGLTDPIRLSVIFTCHPPRGIPRGGASKRCKACARIPVPLLPPGMHLDIPLAASLASCLSRWQRCHAGGGAAMGALLIMSLALFAQGDAGVGRPGEGPRIGVVAPRGAGAGASRIARPPEHTLEACRWGWKSGAPWVECDVLLTGDGVPVVTHDFSTDRFMEHSLDVDQSTLEDIQALDMGSGKDDRGQGLRIPTVGDVLEAIPAGHGLVIEIKSGENSAAPVVNAIKYRDCGG